MTQTELKNDQKIEKNDRFHFERMEHSLVAPRISFLKILKRRVVKYGPIDDSVWASFVELIHSDATEGAQHVRSYF